MRNWLIRTTGNQILGPVSKQKVMDFIQRDALSSEDEVCSGNGYWIKVKEKNLINKYIFAGEDQGFNPVAEAESVIVKKAPQALKTENGDELFIPPSEDLEYPDMGEDEKQLPCSDDLDFPETDSHTQVINLPELELLNSDKKLDLKADVGVSIDELDLVDVNQSTKKTFEIVEEDNFPDEDELEYPGENSSPSLPMEDMKVKMDSTSIEAPSASSIVEEVFEKKDRPDRVLKKKDKVKNKKSDQVTKNKKVKKSDAYLIYILVVLVGLLIFVVNFMFRTLTKSQFDDLSSSFFIQKVYADEMALKKKSFLTLNNKVYPPRITILTDSSVGCDKIEMSEFQIISKVEPSNKILDRCNIKQKPVEEEILENSNNFSQIEKYIETPIEKMNLSIIIKEFRHNNLDISFIHKIIKTFFFTLADNQGKLSESIKEVINYPNQRLLVESYEFRRFYENHLKKDLISKFLMGALIHSTNNIQEESVKYLYYNKVIDYFTKLEILAGEKETLFSFSLIEIRSMVSKSNFFNDYSGAIFSYFLKRGTNLEIRSMLKQKLADEFFDGYYILAHIDALNGPSKYQEKIEFLLNKVKALPEIESYLVYLDIIDNPYIKNKLSKNEDFFKRPLFQVKRQLYKKLLNYKATKHLAFWGLKEMGDTNLGYL